MKIKAVYIGNASEAFVEDRFSTGINIISSDDNNKGKTIVIQSILYALGNDPIFPSTFPYKDYYYIVDCLTEDNQQYSVCRKDNSFIVKINNIVNVFDNLSEFKHFMSKGLLQFPYIIKDGRKKLVDPMLFYQIFFVGQDNKNTANIFQSGYYNKEDFINMLYSVYGIDLVQSTTLSDERIKEILGKLKLEKKDLENKNKILKSKKLAASYVSIANDRNRIEKKINRAEKIKQEISDLNSKRNNAVSRKIKNELTLKELRSLNRTLAVGELHCLDCNSSNIGYSTADKSYCFDISSAEIRKQILDSIEEKISIYVDEIESLTVEINKKQEELQELLASEEVSIESLLLLKHNYSLSSSDDIRMVEIERDLAYYNNLLETRENNNKEVENQKEALISNILSHMNWFYKQIDKDGNLVFNNLFSKKNVVFSGSEGTEFYLSKLYALLVSLNHNYPIIMDCFRDGELSSQKEERALLLLGARNNQVIFTATLKNEESGKYENMANINHIDYYPHTPYKILNESFTDKIKSKLGELSICLYK